MRAYEETDRIKKELALEDHEREMARWLLENYMKIRQSLFDHAYGGTEYVISEKAFKLYNEVIELIKKHEELCK